MTKESDKTRYSAVVLISQRVAKRRHVERKFDRENPPPTQRVLLVHGGLARLPESDIDRSSKDQRTGRDWSPQPPQAWAFEIILLIYRTCLGKNKTFRRMPKIAWFVGNTETQLQLPPLRPASLSAPHPTDSPRGSFWLRISLRSWFGSPLLSLFSPPFPSIFFSPLPIPSLSIYIPGSFYSSPLQPPLQPPPVPKEGKRFRCFAVVVARRVRDTCLDTCQRWHRTGSRKQRGRERGREREKKCRETERERVSNRKTKTETHVEIEIYKETHVYK